MLSLVRWWAIVVGVAAGILIVAVATLVLALVLTQIGVTDPGVAARPIAVVIGFGAGGAVASRMAPVAGRFHGAIASLVMAALVIIVAGRSGSPLPVDQVLLLVFLAILVGGLTGWLVGRRRVE